MSVRAIAGRRSRSPGASLFFLDKIGRSQYEYRSLVDRVSKGEAHAIRISGAGQDALIGV